MRNVLLLLMGLMPIVGCKPAAEPVGTRPSAPEMSGLWTLNNSPSISSSPAVPIPVKGSSSFLLLSNNVAKLTNVYVEEIGDQKTTSASNLYRPTLKTGDLTWSIEQIGPYWSVTIDLQNYQTMGLRILQRGEGQFELRYQSHPDEEPFIYIREAKVKSGD